jgi:hypothetical protein
LLKDSKTDPNKIDLILHNTQLKKLIIKRMQEFKVNPLRLMASTQVRYDDLRLWLVTESVNSKPLSHYEILKVCNMLKIRLRVQLIVEEAEADNAIKSKYRYDRDRSEKITEQNNSEVGQQLSKVTGVDVSSFGISGGIGEIDSGGDGGGNQGEVSQGGEASVTGVEGIGGNDKGVQTWRSGNMATRYETEG